MSPLHRIPLWWCTPYHMLRIIQCNACVVQYVLHLLIGPAAWTCLRKVNFALLRPFQGKNNRRQCEFVDRICKNPRKLLLLHFMSNFRRADGCCIVASRLTLLRFDDQDVSSCKDSNSNENDAVQTRNSKYKPVVLLPVVWPDHQTNRVISAASYGQLEKILSTKSHLPYPVDNVPPTLSFQPGIVEKKMLLYVDPGI